MLITKIKTNMLEILPSVTNDSIYKILNYYNNYKNMNSIIQFLGYFFYLLFLFIVVFLTEMK